MPLRQIQRLVAIFGSGLESFIFYPYCYLCENRLQSPADLICEDCWRSLPLAEPQWLVGKDLERRFPESRFAGVLSMLQYGERVEKVVHLLKYHRRPAVARRLGKCLGELVIRFIDEGNSVFLPVPLHPTRRRERGYNQSELLSHEIASIRGTPVDTRSLVRIRNTRSQATLGRAERLLNVQGAFKVRNERNIAGRDCLLVDDVVTTGATASACAAALLGAGAKNVFLLSAARA